MSEEHRTIDNVKVETDSMAMKIESSSFENQSNQQNDSSSPKDIEQTSKDDSSLKKRKNDFNDSMRSRKKVTKDEYEIRFLISSKDAGGIIGKKGSNITFLRQRFDSSVVVTDCQGPERVLSFTVHSSRVEEILASMIGYLDENNQKPSIELRLLLHTNYVGNIIGKNGTKLKEIRQKNNTSIKIYPQCCPRSSERVCIIQGRPEDVISCIKNILEIVNSHQQSERIFFYHPANYVANGSLEYGGFSTFEPMNSQMQRGTRDSRSSNFNVNNRPARGSNQRSNNRRYYLNSKGTYELSDAWYRNSSFYDANTWSNSDQMNYQSLSSQQMNSPLNSYQQNSCHQTNYQTNYRQNNYQQTNYQASQSSDHSSFPYYQDSTFQSSSNQVYHGKQDGMSNDYNQINHTNNNQLTSNQYSNNHPNTFWTSYYNGNTNQGDGRANLSVLSTVPTSDH